MKTFVLMVVAVLMAGSAFAGPINVCSTGFTANCAAPAGAGTADGNYTLVAVPPGAPAGGPAYVTQNGGYPLVNGVWILNGSGSAWISPTPNPGDNLAGSNWTTGQHYIYQTTFDLPVGLLSATITGDWASDNAGMAILLNGNNIGSTVPYGTSGNYSFQHFTPFAVSNLSFFQPGVNTLQFIVSNGSTAGEVPGPSGLRVQIRDAEFTATSNQVPEPGTFALLMLGLPVGLYFRRQRS